VKTRKEIEKATLVASVIIGVLGAALLGQRGQFQLILINAEALARSS